MSHSPDDRQKTVGSNPDSQGRASHEHPGGEGREEYQRGEPHHPPVAFEIRIDRKTYTVHEHILTGAEIRRLPDPHIGPDRDLFEVVPGGSDLKIEAETKVEMRTGLRFFTAPAQINPGFNSEA